MTQLVTEQIQLTTKEEQAGSLALKQTQCQCHALWVEIDKDIIHTIVLISH